MPSIKNGTNKAICFCASITRYFAKAKTGRGDPKGIEWVFWQSQKPGNAGWSSPVARQAHNLKAAGSNPAPATKSYAIPKKPPRGAFLRFKPPNTPQQLADARHQEVCQLARASSMIQSFVCSTEKRRREADL